MLSIKEKRDRWQKLLEHKAVNELVLALIESPPIEVAEFLESQALTTCINLLKQFTTPVQAKIFTLFSEKTKSSLYEALGPRLIAPIFVEMPSDMRVDFYQQLCEKKKSELLPFLPKQVKKDIILLSAYPPSVAGGIMSTDFVTLQDNMTAAEALVRIREDAPAKKMIYQLYVVDKNMKMLGFISLKDLILTAPDTVIAKLIVRDFAFAQVDEDRENVAAKIEKYNLVALPVLNANEQLVGIVSHDEAFEVIRAEQTEDMERFMGIMPDEALEDYLSTTSSQHFKKRIGWIASLFLVSFISGYIMPRYGRILNVFPVLSFYLTTINDTGGNAGSQVAMVIIRSLALKQITVGHWFTILWKELKVALMCVSCLFLLMIARIVLLTDTDTYVLPQTGIWGMALVVASALAMQVVSSTLIGAMLPLIIKAFKKDPALAASPAITTLVDITGMLIYFTLTSLLLR